MAPVFLCTGPARSIFQSVLGDIPLVDSLQTGMERCEQIVTSTGWQTALEVTAISRALKAGIPVVSILDHWVNYRERFQIHTSLFIPEELWVVDDVALALAMSIFGDESRIVQAEDLHTLELRAEVEVHRRATPREVDATALFLSDDVSGFALSLTGDAQGFGFDQGDSLRDVANWVQCNALASRLLVRPHPAEEHDALARVARQLSLAARMSTNSLAEDLAAVDVVVGLSTAALYAASQCDLKVFSCVPASTSGYPVLPWGFPSIFGNTDALS